MGNSDNISLRALCVAALVADEELAELGLPTDAVYQADTAESPEAKPFLVLRWMEAQPGLSSVKKRPFDLWAYDDMGDPTRAERIASRAADVLAAIGQTELYEGWLFLIEKGEQGTDLKDDQYEALVIPWHMVAVASGI